MNFNKKNPLLYSVFETPEDKWIEIAEKMKAFVPAVSLSVIEKRFKKENLKELEPFVEDLNIVHLWIDISGFTVLAERLHQLYSRAEGEEHLTNILNEYFTKMNSIIEQHEGCIFKIAGDAVSVVWNYEGKKHGENSIFNFLLALDCAVSIQKSLDNYAVESMDGISLSCKIAIGVGIAQFLLVGGEGNQFETVLYGDPLRQTTWASEEAVAGDIILSEKSLQLALSSLSQEECRNFGVLTKYGSRLDHRELSNSFRFAPSESSIDLESRKNNGDNALMKSKFEIEECQVKNAKKFVNWMEKLVPSVVTQRVSHTSEGFHSELRQVSVVFMLLNGITLHETVQSVSHPENPLHRSRWHHSFRESSDQLLGHSFNELSQTRNHSDRLLENENLLKIVQKTFSGIQKKVLEGGGMIRQFILDDKGPVCIAVFGVHSYGDDPQRSVLSSLQIHQFLNEIQVSHSIGITTGRAFCGWVGTNDRREYGIVGDMVNLSARLMGASKTLHHPILCDEETFEVCNPTISFKVLEPIRVKGKSAPVKIYLPLKSDSSSSKIETDRAIVGRYAELMSICDIMEEFVYKGEENVTIIVEGEKGIGKSHLLKEIKQKARQMRKDWKQNTDNEDSIVILSGATSSVQQQTPFYAFRRIFSIFLKRFYPRIFQFLASYFPVLSEGNEEDNLSEKSDEEEEKPNYLSNSLLTSRSSFHEELAEDYGEKVAQSLSILNRILVDQRRNTGSSSENYAIEARLGQLIKVFTDILHDWCRKGGKIIMTIEDVHWLDQASWKMIKRITLDVPLLLILTSRPSISRDLDQLKATENTHLYTLLCMEKDETNAMLRKRFGITKIPDFISSFVWEKTDGNPFFSLELFQTMMENEILVIEEEERDELDKNIVTICKGGNDSESQRSQILFHLLCGKKPMEIHSFLSNCFKR
eukprot:TRINITY_DN3182_c0_g1_i1.p1 TRINITY_DN3182_c0_g1~~TRINITY_DN3182_c0_g1_i1.p1  ORF type:complete len:928 (-),score=315.99 TRINITY_DN3182_c0_g1_i1:74-2857(-)